MKEIQIQINPYLEYINSILLTGKYNEITAPVVGYGLMTDEENEYTTAIKTHFAAYRNHPIYALIEEMIPEGFTFARPVELALSLGENTGYTVQQSLSEFCVDCCGGMSKIEELLGLWKEFDREVDYFSFYHKNRGFYNSYLEKACRMTEEIPYVSMLEEEYGVSLGNYRVVLTSLMKGNFGFEMEDKESGQNYVYSVISTFANCISPVILFHEFSHPFINPLTEKYDERVAKCQEAYERLKSYKLPGFESGYGDWQECVNEHLVRAMVIHLLRKCKLFEEAEQQLCYDLGLGYKYIPWILESYEHYDKNRETYHDFESYYPELLKVFSKNCNTFE